jgi:polysaccharide export outer membrane protein
MRFLRVHLLRCAYVALLALLAGCASDGSAGVNQTPPVPTSNAELRSGDTLTVALQGVPDPSNNTVTIDDAGLVTLPYIGNIQAAGLSTAQLSQRIRDTYIAKKIYTTVDVSVSVTERYVYVGGEVQHPGRVIWTPDLTAGKAVQAAGGFTLYGKESAVRLIRGKQSYIVDLKHAQKNPGEDPHLIPGDSLDVPRSPF